MSQRKIWDTIAEGWTNWRPKPMRWATLFSEENKPGRILDIGCGNGRNLVPFAKRGFDCYGVDFSANMKKLASNSFKKQGLKAKFKVADASKLPYRSGIFDYCISMAVLHHLETEKGRSAALSEIRRVLKPKGRALITVWNKHSKRFKHLSKMPKDAYIPWRRKGKVYERFYHLYSYWELRHLLTRSGFKILRSGGIFDENIIFIFQKK